MPTKKNRVILFHICAIVFCSGSVAAQKTNTYSEGAKQSSQIEITDQFWGPRLKLWSSKTVNDVFDKFEGKYDYINSRKQLTEDFEKIGKTRDAFLNFDRVAQGERGIKKHDGPEWYDGLIYESITGASDFLKNYPDEKIEKRIDQYIDRIAAAQNSVGDGYINTYTLLVEPDHRYGLNGGFEVSQHDLYNSGALIEAGIHYFNATGKTRLLDIAVKAANNICRTIGPSPKKNVIPGHALPEEALVKLYVLFNDNPALKKQMSEDVDEEQYFDIVKFWYESRGNHCGLPNWSEWTHSECVKWIRDKKYLSPEFGSNARPSFGNYNQDSVPFDQQKTIEGHAVRATLYANGMAKVATVNNDRKYINISSLLWDNMVGKRMYITGGVGALHKDEMFAPDYVLPNDGYSETCAAVGSCFFSESMATLHRDGKYFDEFERALYNNVLAGISISGDHYSYINPLTGQDVSRWGWHECPCCPPMFLKLAGSLTSSVYAVEDNTIFVNLFMSNKTKIDLSSGKQVDIKQTTRYPFDGKIDIAIDAPSTEFTLKVRIPGWAQGIENPFGLYQSGIPQQPSITINRKPEQLKVVNGYVEITRQWSKGDIISLSLPVIPRFIKPNENIAELKGMVAVSAGPLVYGWEETDNPQLLNASINTDEPLTIKFDKNLMNGVNIITAQAVTADGKNIKMKGIPFYALNNRQQGNAFEVWLNATKK